MKSGAQSPYPVRLARALLGAAAGAVLLSGVVAIWSSSVDAIPVFSAFGLLGLVGLMLVVPVAVWVSLVHRCGEGWELKRQLETKQRRTRLALSGVAGVSVLWVVGQLGLRLLVAFQTRPQVGAVLLATSALGCFTFTAWSVDKVGTLAARRWGAPSASSAMIAAVALPLVLFAAFIAVGEPSGTGGPLSLFGVFKREELSLRPAFQLAGLAAGAYAAGLYSARLALRSLAVLGGAALLMWLGALVSLRGISVGTAVKVERSPGVEGAVPAVVQGADDHDGDGSSARFGGGDCNDANPNVSPMAQEIPGNGVDDNCSGSDLAPRKKAPSVAKAKKGPVGSVPEGANVLLLSIDTLRAELGYSGHPNPKISPHLDALAKRSTVFENAYALASYTSKSLGPMMIGRYPSETERTFEHFDRFAKTTPFLQERIQQAGIRTLSVQGYWYFFLKGYGFERGWDTLNSGAAPKLISIEGDKTSNGDELAKETVAELTKLASSKKRFFAWTHWVDPHSEYVKHEKFDYGKKPRQRYDGEVSFVDAQVGKVVDALGELGLAESTVIVVTSDHGEAFGEHGMIRHGFEVWEELVRIPLLVHVPGAEARRVSTRRSMIDVAPTVFEALGLDEPKIMRFFRGTSLLNDVFASGKPEARPVLVDMPKGPHNKSRQAFYDGSYKLIRGGGRVLGVYDLDEDPKEKNDLSEDAVLVGKLQDALDSFVADLELKKPR